MTLYWDTSAFVLLYLQVPRRRAAETALRGANANLFSKLTIFEAYLTLTSLGARGHIPVAEARQAIGRLRQDQVRLNARSVDGLLRTQLLETYLSLLERYWKLGTNDVLHLTTAVAWKSELKRKVTMVTRDTRLASAAKEERLGTLLLAA